MYPNVFDPATASAESIRLLFILVLAICGGILAIVWGVLAWCLVRYRRSGTQEPPQVYGSHPIEIAWTAFPSLIVLVLVLITVRCLNEVHAVPSSEEGEPIAVRVVGHQWWWEYAYDGFTTANELHLPAGRPVMLQLESVDVCHSFWVPRLAGKMDLIPGRRNLLRFRCDIPGVYLGQCAEFCGTQHANMLLRVIVEPADEFDAWRASQRQRDVAGDHPGAKVFARLACVRCHAIRGTSADGLFGPDLTHLMSRTTLGAGVMVNNRENLRRWIRDPQPDKPGCLMPGFDLGRAEMDALVGYLERLR